MLVKKTVDKKRKRKRKVFNKEEFVEEKVYLGLPLDQNPHTQAVSVYYEAIAQETLNDNIRS